MNTTTLWSVNWNQKKALELMLRSYALHHYKSVPLPSMIVDNGSTDGSKEWLRENGIPFIDLAKNAGHEWALNFTFGAIPTDKVLLVDSDIKFKSSVQDYLEYLKGDCISVGELMENQFYGPDELKSRICPWFWLFDIQKLKDKGVTTFRDTGDWTYDTGSWLWEKMRQNGFTNHAIKRLSQSSLGSDYERFFHFSQVSSADANSEITERRAQIEREAEALKNVNLAGVFAGAGGSMSAEEIGAHISRGYRNT